MTRALPVPVRRTLCAGLLLTFQVPLVCSHPHSWVEIDTTLVWSEDSRLVGLAMTWHFDIYYSSLVLDDMRHVEQPLERQLGEEADTMINNLYDYHYFSELALGELKVSLLKPQQYRLTASDGRLALSMELPFERPLDPAGKVLTLSVYDPSYYVAMYHVSEASVHVGITHEDRCRWEIIDPDPGEDMIEYAQSLDQSQRDTVGLGNLFAEKVVIRC
jgi:ABC-type uncharacterized transport system substrate-binding protein